jgi:hypothetical protein
VGGVRGVTVKTPERVAEAMLMRAQGKQLQQIADHFGVSVQAVSAWLADPDGTALRARKDSYSGLCDDCGAPTSGWKGRRAHPRCVPCSNRKVGDERKIWTAEAVVLAIQEWAHEYGTPPAIPDWSPTQARINHDERRAARAEENIAAGKHPWAVSAIRAFGTWNAAIEAAGFEPRAPHGGGGNGARHRSVRARATA